MKWSFEWFEGDLSQELLDDWECAVRTSGNVWANRHLVQVWGETIGQENGFEPIMLKASCVDNTLLYPLFFKKNKRLKIQRYVVMPAGGWYQFTFQDPIEIKGSLSPETWNDFWCHFKRETEKKFAPLECLDLRRIRFSGEKALGFEKFAVAPRMKLDGFNDFDDCLATLRSSHRKNVRRQIRQADAQGGLEFGNFEQCDVSEALALLFEFHQKQWDNRAGQLTLGNSVLQGFIKGLAKAAASEGIIDFTYTKVGGEYRSLHFGFRHNNILFWYKPCYNLDFKRYSPGLVHLAKLVEREIALGTEYIDFGYGDESYKFLWTSESIDLFRLQHSAKGVFLGVLDSIAANRRKV